MSDIKFSTIMVDLDSLLDTRLSVINSLGIDYLKLAFKNKYAERLIDQWEWMNNAEFTTRYANRDKSILKDACKTNIVKLVAEFVKVTIDAAVTTPIIVDPKVIINVYPYKLVDSELDVIKTMMLSQLPGLMDENLTFVNLPIAEITPSYVKNNISSLVLYNWWDWLELHLQNGNFKTTSCPEAYLIGPELFTREVPDAMSMQKAKVSEMTHFEALAVCVAMHIRLDLLGSLYFSMDMGFSSEELSKRVK